jgi:pimeloyl-ACP methyl ester carboxylesterase
MVLLVPAAYVPHPGNEPSLKSPSATAWLFDTVLQSDFLFWAAIRIMRPVVIRAILATPPSVVETASHEEQERVSNVLAHILPVSPRRLGLLNDATVTSTLSRYDLEKIQTPSLLITAGDDLFGTFDGARYTAEHLPQARFIGYREGGHMLVGHYEEVMAQIAAFLR